ncbi:MAG: DNA repair protein RadC [Candidatus Aerophobetes bacterium]|nr:DNA repair protein RadC [Candidatus Aerophobetes bacterium]
MMEKPAEPTPAKGNLMKERERLIELLLRNRIYPMYSKRGKIYFLKPKHIQISDEEREEIVRKLRLKTAEDCKKIRQIVMDKLARMRINKPIKKWIREERPREMLVKYGAERLSLSKLLAIILRTGREGISAENLAKRLLNHFGSLRKINSASIQELREIDGIGMAKASQIKASLEVGKRLIREKAERKRKISNAKDVISYVHDYYSPYLRDSKKEFFNIILLDVKNKVIDNMELSKGGLSGTVVDTTEIIKEATRKSVSSIILVHNHPSGEVEPSKEDIQTTRKITEVCKLVGIKVLDHIIVGKNEGDFFSFSAHRMI